jgi:hypothetical protein
MATVNLTIAMTLPEAVIAEAATVGKLQQPLIGGYGKPGRAGKPRASKPMVVGVRNVR